MVKFLKIFLMLILLVPLLFIGLIALGFFASIAEHKHLVETRKCTPSEDGAFTSVYFGGNDLVMPTKYITGCQPVAEPGDYMADIALRLPANDLGIDPVKDMPEKGFVYVFLYSNINYPEDALRQQTDDDIQADLERDLANDLQLNRPDRPRTHGEGMPSISGFTKYPLIVERNINGDIYVRRNVEGKIELKIDCNSLNRHAYAKCQYGGAQQRVLIPSVDVSYSYAEEYLPHAEQIHKRIISIVDAFKDTDNIGYK